MFSGLIKRELVRFKEFSNLSLNYLKNEGVYLKLCDQYSMTIDTDGGDDYE